MSSLNSLYKLDELNLNKSSGFNMPSNYYNNKVKEGLPIFQEIGSFSNTLNNQNFVDPFKILENTKYNNYLNNNIQGPGANLGAGSLSSNINTTDIETRKIIEREMNPYLLQMKNELNLIIEKFRKEMEDKSNILKEISTIKEQTLQINQNNDINFTNYEKKLLNIKDITNSHDKKLIEIQNEFNQINRTNILMSKKIEDLYNNIINIDKINNKLQSIEISYENINNNINNNIDNITKNKFEELENKISSIKKENINCQNNIMNNLNKINSLIKENENRNKKINDIETNIYDNKNEINNLKLNNNKNLNLINNFEIKNYDFQQKIKLFNEQLSALNNNINTANVDIKSNKQTINTSIQKIYDIENAINLLKNERQSFNNKILEMNNKINLQEEKINKNNNLLNNAVNQNQNALYNDSTKQISLLKNSIEQLKDEYEKEISSLKNDYNQINLIIKNNPFLNMSENERISLSFKKEQIKTNEIFGENIKLLREEINKIKNANPIDKGVFKKIENNFKVIDNTLQLKIKDINLLEQSVKTYTEIIKALSDKIDKIKNEKNDPVKNKPWAPMGSEYNLGEFDENIQKIKQYINNNIKDVNDLKIDIQKLNKTIPEIYKYIDEKINKLNNNLKNENIDYNINNNKYPKKIDDDFNNNNFNNKPVNKYNFNKKNDDIIFNDNFNLNNNLKNNFGIFNIENKNNNYNKEIENKNNNFNVNKEIDNKNNNFNLNKEIDNKINNNQKVEENNNNNILNNNQNLDDLADRIEALNAGGQNSSKGFNQNNESNNNINININIENENNWSKDKNNNEKMDESDSIDKIVKGIDKKESKNYSQKSFEKDFDD